MSNAVNYRKVVAEIEAVVRARNSGDFSPILPKLKAIVNEHSDEPVFLVRLENI